jgi:hypothetical protein
VGFRLSAGLTAKIAGANVFFFTMAAMRIAATGKKGAVMGYFTDFFVAPPEDALLYEALMRSEDPLPPNRFQRVEYKNFTPLELEMLWAILSHEEWDVKKHRLDYIDTGSEESLLCRFPDALTLLLSQMDDAAINHVAAIWVRAEEVLADDAEELVPVLRDLRHLAGQARQNGKGLYQWISG